MFYHYFDMDTPRLRGEKVFSNNLIVNNYSVKTKGKISHSDGANEPSCNEARCFNVSSCPCGSSSKSEQIST